MMVYYYIVLVMFGNTSLTVYWKSICKGIGMYCLKLTCFRSGSGKCGVILTVSTHC